jgi:hypothetical protein
VTGASSDDLSKKALGSFDALSASYFGGDFIGMLLSKTLLVVTQHSAWHLDLCYEFYGAECFFVTIIQ